jgi:D-inositol-3-phosphate glycosyltransferase
MDDFADELTAAWRRDRPDVVHAHFWMSGRAALAAAGRLGIPVVHTFHALGVVKRRYQGDRDTSPPGRLAIERDIVTRVDHVIATCTDELFELIRLGAANARLTVVPSGVDLDRFSPDGPADRRRNGLRRLLCVGRLVERKGIGNAIEALAEVPDTELVVVGGAERERLAEDPDAQRLLAVAREAGVEHRVDLRGRVDRERLPALLRSADAVVCAPWYEPFGIVPLEAMACGVPVVAAAVGGMIDTVVDGVTGAHVPPRQADALAAALRRLLDDKHLRARLGAAGARRVHQLYTWHRVADSVLNVYGETLPARAVAQGLRV